MVFHKKLPKVRSVHSTRRFVGKLFKQHDWYTSKMVAGVAADTLKMKGYLTRITLRPKSKVTGGYPLRDLYYLWKRRG